MIVGLDVSTSCTGVAAVTDDGQPLIVGAVTTGHLDSLRERASAVAQILTLISSRGEISAVFVEESLQAFRPGFSSANTICSLAKMNGVVAVLAESILGATVSYLSSQSARKICDVKIKRGDNAKEKVVEWAASGSLREWEMPTKKRSDGVAEQVKDACDALVIATAGASLIRERSRSVHSEHCDVHLNSVISTLVPGEGAGQDRCVQVWKGSSCALSVSVVPVST